MRTGGVRMKSFVRGRTKGLQVLSLIVLFSLFTAAAYAYLSSQALTKQAAESSTSTNLICTIAPKGSTLTINVTRDGGNSPATNVTISATPVEVCNGVKTTIAVIYHPVLNAHGIAVLNSNFLTYYEIVVGYNGQNYPIQAAVSDYPSTCAKLSVPSGKVLVGPC